jgi:tetratricopeptide (TPR) repeat protein
MKRTLLILSVLLFTLTARAADKWTAVQSKNFFLVGNASESQIREVAENLELFRTAYGKFFKLRESAATVGTTVIVFKSDAAFRPYKPIYQGKPANIAGYFQGGQDKNLIVLSAEIETPRVIYHEYVHRLMSDNLSSKPPFFQEGFAECFSTLEIEGRDKKLRLGRAIAEHVALLNERRFLPLEQLFAVTNESKEYNEEEKQGLFYAESWALVHYMMLGPRERMNQFFEFLNGLNSGTPAPIVFQRVFKQDLPTFQKTFEAYIQQRMAWPAMEISSPGTLDRNKDMSARTLTEAEAEFYLGDMLLHDDRLGDAEPHLRASLRLDPNLASAQAAMGRLMVRQSKESDAMGYLKRAIQLDPRNYLAHYYYASAIQGENRTLSEVDWSIARAELLQAIELAPQFTAATESLANLNLVRNAEIPQTIDLLRKALTFAPGNDNLIVMLSFALSRTAEREEARALADAVLMKGSLTATMRKNAETVLASLSQGSAPSQVRKPPNAPTQLAAPAGTATLRGTFTRLECGEPMLLVLTVDGKTVKLHTRTPNSLRITTSDPTLSSTIGCGPLPRGGIPATIVYRPGASADSIGEVVAVELGAER